MTVAALPAVAEYVEDGASTRFAVPFRFKAPTDLVVERILLDGTLIALAIGVDYTVIGGTTDAGGTVIRSAATSGGTLRIRRQTARAQPMAYPTGGRFPAESHEAALDRQMLIAQEQDVQQADTATRALLVPIGEAAVDLPTASARAGSALVFDESGNPLAKPIGSFPPGPTGGNVMSTGAKTAANGLVVPTSANQVITDSYSGDGKGQAPYVRNRGTTSDHLTKYPRFTFRSADLDAWEMPVRGPTILEAGGKPDGSDSIDAFEQARDWAFERGVNEIYVPNTRTDAGFRISRTLNIDCPVTIRGPSGGRAGADRGKAIIRVAKGQDGIVVHTGLTSPRQGDARAVGGENTRITGLMLIGDPDDLQTRGIRLRARAEVTENIVQYFGYSCYIRATAGLGGDSEGNANHWLVRGCRFDTPRQDCLYLAGGDANAGLAIDCDMAGANGWAVNNEAFLSNTFIALQSVSCGNYNSRRGGTFAGVNYDSGQGYWYYVPTVGATPTQLANTTPGTNSAVWTLVYKMANPTPPIWQAGNTNYRPGGPYASFNVNSSSMFLGCYSESDMGPSQFNTPSMCIAGTHAAGVIGGAFQYNRFGMVATPIGFVVYDTVTGRYVTLGGAVGDGILSEFYDPINFPGPLSLRMGSSGRIVMSGNGRGDGNEFYALHGNGAARPGHFALDKLYAPFPIADNDAGAAASGVKVDCAYRKSDGTLAWRKS